MLGRKTKEQLHKQNVQSLNNDYVRSNPQAKVKAKAKQAVLRRRRMAVFFVLAVAVIGFLVNVNMAQNEKLLAKIEQKDVVTEALNEVTAQQEMLNLQIMKLEDDEYIAKLARKEFFLSEEGEYIFTIPKATEKNNEEDSDKQD
ncbi:septum formation initiator [Solibacillus sp. R5-41]|uniref:FtsB family cell division protein n=1 Tax=Solibacillus sp. R5-41 TaxID=2048654 RepID=UPI000C1281AE|nr:septum formation initiator family protein [Solibacillus sp. R5-41]ATP38623.1 septum formation initiator [Solibacillus sp. R5-41]